MYVIRKLHRKRGPKSFIVIGYLLCYWWRYCLDDLNIHYSNSALVSNYVSQQTLYYTHCKHTHAQTHTHTHAHTKEKNNSGNACYYSFRELLSLLSWKNSNKQDTIYNQFVLEWSLALYLNGRGPKLQLSTIEWIIS